MKRLLFFIALFPVAVWGQQTSKEYLCKVLDKDKAESITEMSQRRFTETIEKIERLMLPKQTGRATTTDSEMTITTTESGQLARLLGDKKETVESLIIEGPINDSDFQTLWEATFYGNLTELNLRKAQPEDDCIPNGAFYHREVQYKPQEKAIYIIQLQRVVLPERIKSIGTDAFYVAMDLESVTFPYFLEKIGETAFCYTGLKNGADSPFTLPYGLMEVGYAAFRECHNLKGILCFMHTPRTIDEIAFYQTGFSRLVMENGIKTIGNLAFGGCAVTNLWLPQSLKETSGRNQFAGCQYLKSLYIEEGFTSLTPEMFANCYSLERVNLPSTTTSIQKECFISCSSLKEIYCGANVPPTLVFNETTGASPFEYVPKTLTLYVPTGTKELYRSAKGWSDFENIVETESFPTGFEDTEVEAIEKDAIDERGVYYDLQGRRVATPSEGKLYIVNGKKVIHRQ
ncbi:MAG: leucine-rich repeat domain-containing protein [Muribaculaceae bacterium]|nr:leucine-rich repeat domain-containing protein [Muribaculaceae bacterium]